MSHLGHRRSPRYRTAHDGRITLFGKELAAELLQFDDPRLRPSLIEKYELEILVVPPHMVPHDDIAIASVRDPVRRWIIVHSDPVAVVLVDVHGKNFEHNASVLK